MEDGDEYWSYDHFNQDGWELSKTVTGLLNGDSSFTASDAILILERIFGVDFGGWGFGISLPGSIGADISLVYTLMLGIDSTEDVRTNKTPTCILNVLVAYHEGKFNQFIDPSDFDTAINDYMDTIARYGPSSPPGGLPSAYDEVKALLLDNGFWAVTPDRYAFVEGFGWFDARHATLGFAIGYNWHSADRVIKTFETFWENRQEKQGFCRSAWVREDIYSNHIGSRAGDSYHDNATKTPGELMRDEIGAPLLGRGATIAELIADGINITLTP